MGRFLVCHSGGVSSAQCALTLAEKYDPSDIILLNHNIIGTRETKDTKRFKQEVADYLGLPITYANHPNWDEKTPVQVCVDAGAWKVGSGQILCTNRLKTAPFMDWLEQNDPNKELICVYGFDKNELTRVTRRSQIMGNLGWKTEFPMLLDERQIIRISEVGIKAPNVYETFKHANCTGCLKAGWQHWYIVYCTRPDVWNEAKWGENEIGYSIHSDSKGIPVYLEDKEELFEKMRLAGVKPTEHIKHQTFWAQARKAVKKYEYEIEQMQLEDEGVCLECMA